ncbi:uncharacterized protein LOC119497475 [Sebastes umbrosus]|uniref:uncharacterized protein LOC119497475 n=1 Tax=Sebastes umbrosus TaxID=72105 RepID=UPI00189DA76A|nr:uncharacterized protein LOC119497475 [Sebastes umbrosus]
MDVKTNLDEDAKKTPLPFQPEHIDAKYSTSYRFKCPGPGVFQCESTGMVFVMAQEAELKYKTVIWDDNILQPAGKAPAGCLYKIECSEDAAVCQLHLPHCETKEALLLDSGLSVVHMTDDGMSILEPLEITDTHVVVKVPHLSAFGLVWDVVRRFLKDTLTVKGKILLFLRPMSQAKHVLYVFMLQANIPLHEVAVQQGRSQYIKMSSDCELDFGERYSVHCPENTHIQPEVDQFHIKNGPNFHPTFEIFLATTTEKVTVTVATQESKEIWKRHVSMKEPRGEIPAEDSIPAVGSVPAEGSVPAVGSVPAEGSVPAKDSAPADK